MNPRQIVLELLTAWSNSRQFADELLAEQNAIPARDRAFVQELFYGCLRHHLALDFMLRQLASKPPRPIVADILHLGLYQLFFLEKIPAHAAVNESVALAKQFASPAEAKFVNAILRRAAPGGKTTYIAQKMRDLGKIIAADSSNVRLGKVSENCQRLGVNIVATLACEGTRLDRCLRGTQFDRVLLDAPCSNTGVMRRRVDLRWRLQAEEIARLAKVQSQLLTAAGEFVKPGGVLAYSTCSLEPEENERIVEQFQESHPKFTLDTTRSIFPPRDKMDGAFVARFRRNQI